MVPEGEILRKPGQLVIHLGKPHIQLEHSVNEQGYDDQVDQVDRRLDTKKL